MTPHTTEWNLRERPGNPPMHVLGKLAHIIYYVDAGEDPKGRAIQSLMTDPDVKEWMAGMMDINMTPVLRRPPPVIRSRTRTKIG